MADWPTAGVCLLAAVFFAFLHADDTGLTALAVRITTDCIDCANLPGHMQRRIIGQPWEQRRAILHKAVVSDPSLYNKPVMGNLEAPLAYKHMPKAGGTFLTAVLRETFGDNVLVVNDFISTNHFFNATLSGRARDEAGRQFLLGSVREPCDYYVSLWAFGRQQLKRGAERGFVDLAHDMSEARKAALYLDETPAGFRAWLREFAGVFSIRLLQSYGGVAGECFSARECAHARATVDWGRVDGSAVSRGMADCWVDAKDMRTGLAHCLRRYADVAAAGGTGGAVDWARLDAAIEAAERRSRNPSAHEGCEHYFDEASRELVAAKDVAVTRAFGYTCCGGPFRERPWEEERAT